MEKEQILTFDDLSFSPQPDSPATLNEIRDSYPEWQRIKSTEIQFPPNLLNVGLAFNALENVGYVPKDTKKYIEANVRTQAFEAVAPGVIMRTYQAWDETQNGLVAYGVSTSGVYRKGLGDIPRLREIHGDNIDFEEERRQIELLQSISLDRSVSSGLMDTHQMVWISPFPKNADANTARELGYFAEKGVSMIRTYNYDSESGLMSVEQIAVEQTDLEAFTKMISLLEGENVEKTLNPSEVLSRQIFVPKEKLRSGVTTLARVYDRILESQDGQRHFLGEPIGDVSKDYIGIVEKTVNAQRETAKIVDHLVESSIEIAISIKDKRSSVVVQNLIKLALQQTQDGQSLLTPEGRNILMDSINGSFGVETAGILIDFITKNNYLAMLCLTNPKRAMQIFKEEDLENFQKRYRENPSLTNISAPPMLPNQTVGFYFCGAVMEVSSAQSFMTSPMSQFNSFLREGVRIFCCTCPFCNKKVEAQIFAGKIHCPSPPNGCGKSADWNN